MSGEGTGSLRERLKSRSFPKGTFRIRIGDDTEAREELGKAQRELRLAQAREDTKGTKAAQAKVDKATADVEACYEDLTLVALPPADMEALMAAHPPKKDDEDDEDDAPWHAATFRPALLAACVQDEMTEDDWVEMYKSGPMSLGELADLFQEALRVNNRSPVASLGKDWMSILS